MERSHKATNGTRCIRGQSILGLQLHGSAPFDLVAPFEIDLEEKGFSIEYEEQVPIDYAAFMFARDINMVPALYCIDDKGIPFTLFDCYAQVRSSSLKSVGVIWNRMLYGVHIPYDKNTSAEKMVCLVDNDTLTWRMSLGQGEYSTANLMIRTDWHKVGGKYDGVQIVIEPSGVPLSIPELMDTFLHFLEFQWLLIGYFPTIKEIRFTLHGEDADYLQRKNSLYSTASHKVRLERRLFPANETALNTAFARWMQLRERNTLPFAMLFFVQSVTSLFDEVKVATTIQCIEGYFRNEHAAILQRFDEATKQRLHRAIKDSLEGTEGITHICEERLLDRDALLRNVSNMLGYMHQMSLREVLRKAMMYTDEIDKAFLYEASHEYTKKDGKKAPLIDLFIKKATNHRNWMAHQLAQEDRFMEAECDIAQEKYELLLRLAVLHDIGVAVETKQLDTCIEHINTWYQRHSLQ